MIESSSKNKLTFQRKSLIMQKEPTVTSTSNGDSSPSPDSKAQTLGKLDQVPEPRVTYFRRDQVELGYRGPAGPGSGMFNMGNTCYLNSTLQVIGYSCVVNI